MVAAGEARPRGHRIRIQMVTNLCDGCQYYTIGRQIGPGCSVATGNPEAKRYYPIDGGEQYEPALRIIS